MLQCSTATCLKCTLHVASSTALLERRSLADNLQLAIGYKAKLFDVSYILSFVDHKASFLFYFRYAQLTEMHIVI